MKIEEPKINGVSVEETTQTEIQNATSTEATKFVSVRRFWQGVTRIFQLAWSFLEIITFQKGITLGNNSLPATNGNLWSNGVALLARLGGVVVQILTSVNGKYANVAFVSKEGNDSTAVLGSKLFPFFTVQAAINASTNHNIKVYKGIYTENLNVVGKGTLVFQLYDAVLNSCWTLTGTSVRIEMHGVSEIGNNGANTDTAGASIASTSQDFYVKNGNVRNSGAGVGIRCVSGPGWNVKFESVNFVNTTSSGGNLFVAMTGNFEAISCRVFNSASTNNITLGFLVANARFTNCFVVNTSSGNAFDISSHDNQSISIQNCYVRSQNGIAIASAVRMNRLQILGGYVISNNNVALQATVNDSVSTTSVYAKGVFFYGTNCVNRDNGITKRTILDFVNCDFFATTGEILVGLPTFGTPKCRLTNCKGNKLLSPAQIADTNLFFDNYILDVLLQTPYLTLTN